VNFPQLISYAEQFLTIAALIGVVWSAYVFIRSISERRNLLRAEQIATWRKASVHKLLHTVEKFSSVADITKSLRSSSFDTSLDISKTELTDDVVRLLLLEMLSAGTIKQLWGDRYGISHFDPAAEIQDLAVTRDRVVREAFAFIHMAPGNFDTESLRLQVARSIDVSPSNFALTLVGMVQSGSVIQDENGHWIPTVVAASPKLIVSERAKA
jgi:hypothetical protein